MNFLRNSSKPLAKGPEFLLKNKDRRGVLQTFVVALATYATSFFVTNVANASECTGRYLGDGLEDYECITAGVGSCIGPGLDPNWTYYTVYYGTRNPGTICCWQIQSGPYPTVYGPDNVPCW